MNKRGLTLLEALPWIVTAQVILTLVIIIFVQFSYDAKRMSSIEQSLHQTYQDQALDVSKIVNTSVTIRTQSLFGRGGSGSGTVIKKTANAMFILTAAHVVSASDDFEFEPSPEVTKWMIEYVIDGKIHAYSGVTIVKYDDEHDIALIRVSRNDRNLSVAPVANFAPKQGDTAYVVGSPLGNERNLSKGIISSTSHKGFYVFDGLTTFGNSGGGMFNTKGELIGIPDKVEVYPITAFGLLPLGAVPESNLGFSISLDVIQKFLEGVRYK